MNSLSARFVAWFKQFVLLAILLFAAGFCWYNRDTLTLALRLGATQWLLVVAGYLGCYWLNALMACQVQWKRGTTPALGEMLVINSYASLLGYATVLRAGFYGGKLWFYRERFGLSASVSLGLQGWVSLLVLAGNAVFGVVFGVWLLVVQQLQLPWVHWALVIGTLVLTAGVVLLLWVLTEQRWLPQSVRLWLGNMRSVIAAADGREMGMLGVEAMLNIPLQALSFWVLCSAFGLAVPVPFLLLMALVSNLSLVIALTPSNLGVKELVLWQLLVPLQLPKVELLSVMMVDRILQFLVLAIISAAGYRLLRRVSV